MIFTALVASVILSNPPACSGQTCDMQMSETLAGARSSAPKDIVVVASEAGDFNTLIAAAKAAGLVEVLQSKGPLTVFAPTDAAFAKLPKGTVETLLKPENKKALVEILTYHVVPGKLEAADVLKKKYLGTANGERAKIAMKNGKPTIAGANIVATDVEASNGVIHVIDAVMIPEQRDIVDVARLHRNIQDPRGRTWRRRPRDHPEGQGPLHRPSPRMTPPSRSSPMERSRCCCFPKTRTS